MGSGADAEIKNDANAVGDALESYGFDAVTRFDSKDHTLGTVIQGIRDAAAGLGPDDRFLLYVSSHTELVDDDDDGKPDGDRARRLDYGKGDDNASKWSIMGRGSPAVDLLELLEEIEAGTINLVVDACYSASVIANMEKPVGGGSFAPAEGVTLNVFASSSATKPSEGATGAETIGDALGLTDAGSTYTEGLVERLEGARATGTLQPGEARTLTLRFLCTTTDSFEATARLTATNPDGSRTSEDSFVVAGAISGSLQR